MKHSRAAAREREWHDTRRAYAGVHGPAPIAAKTQGYTRIVAEDAASESVVDRRYIERALVNLQTAGERVKTGERQRAKAIFRQRTRARNRAAKSEVRGRRVDLE